jgi:hypothetical protein
LIGVDDCDDCWVPFCKKFMADTACWDSGFAIVVCKKLARSFLLVVDSALDICESLDFLREVIREKDVAVRPRYRVRFCWM